MKHIFIISALLCSFQIFAQTKEIRIVDAQTNEAIADANIRYLNNQGTTSNQQGIFSIDCNNVKEITISHIGYETQIQVIKNCKDNILISLSPVSNRLNDVEITSTSTENKSLLNQAVSISKIGIAEIKRGTGLYLDDAINGNVPGVTMNRRAVSSGQQFNIRGYGNGVGIRGANSNFDTQGSKVYLNGIPITDAEGITVLDDIDFGSIGNVEIVKGPSGALYGLAIAGVVNLKTIQPAKGKTSIGQEVLIGDFGLRRYTTRLLAGKENASLMVSYGHQKSDGYLIHNSSKKDFINIAGEFTPNKKETLNIYFGYSNSYDERAGELTIEQYEKFDYSGNKRYIKNNAHSQVIGFRAGVGHTYQFNEHVSNTTSVFASGNTNNSSSAGGWTDKSPVNFGLRSTFNTVFSLGANVSLSGITGVETQKQNAQTIGYSMVTDSSNIDGYNIIGPIRSNQFTSTATTSIFTAWSVSLPSQISITAGIGISNMKIALNDRLFVPTAVNARSNYEKTYPGMVAPNISVNKVFNKQFSIYAAYSRGFKAPVSSNFFIPATGALNTNLKPEKGDQFEIGTKGATNNGNLTYQLALFNTLFADKFYFVAVPLDANTTAYTYVANGGKENNKGIEFLIKYTLYESGSGFIRSVKPFANFTYSDFKYKDYQFESLTPDKKGKVSADYDGKAVAGVAPVIFNAGVDFYSNVGLYANAIFNYKDAMPITSDGLNKTKQYSLLNAKVGYQKALSNHFEVNIFFGANNITGTQYPIMVFINQLADAYIPGPFKINYFGGVNLKYNF